jgi:hypothetical protein
MCSTGWSLVVEILSRAQSNFQIFLSPFKVSNLGKLVRQICQKDCTSAVGNFWMRNFCSKLVPRGVTRTIIPIMLLAHTTCSLLVLIYDCEYGCLCVEDWSKPALWLCSRTVVRAHCNFNGRAELPLPAVFRHGSWAHMPNFLIYNTLGTLFYVYFFPFIYVISFHSRTNCLKFLYISLPCYAASSLFF